MLSSLFADAKQYAADYGSLAVMLAILLEDFGMPLPGETMLIAAAMAASQGSIDIVWLIVLGTLGAVIGDNIGYVIGRTGGHHLMCRYGSRVGITHERFAKVSEAFRRYGDAVIIFARFVILLRQFNGIVAGTLEMHWARFLVLNAIGAVLWVTFWGLAAYFLGHGIFAYIHRFGRIEHVVIAGCILAALGIGVHWWWRRSRATPVADQVHPADRRPGD